MRWDEPAPREHDAEERSWQVVRAAWEERVASARPSLVRRRWPLIAFATALAVIAAADAPDNPHARSLAGALASLSPEHRAVIVLRHLLEYTPSEIAELLGLPRGTVNSRLRRGLDTLERMLGEELE